MNLLPASTTASILGWKHLQPYAKVALGRLAIASVTLAINQAAVL
jgi:hypothetical protein